MTPNRRHWFEAEPPEEGKAEAPGFYYRASRALVAEGFWEAFLGGTFIFIRLPQAPATSLQHLARRQQQAADAEAHSQHQRFNLPTPKASQTQSSPSHPGHATCEGNIQKMRLGESEPLDKEHLPAQGAPSVPQPGSP